MTNTSKAGDRVSWLVVTEEVFIPADSGGRVESRNILGAAQAAGIDLHVIVPGLRDADVADHRAALPGATFEASPRRSGWLSHASASPFLFRSRPLPADRPSRLGREQAENGFEAVVAASFRVAHIGIALARSLQLPLVVRPHNIESEYFDQLAASLGWPRGMPHRVEAWKLRRAENAVHASPTVSLFADIARTDADRRSDRTRTPVIHLPPFLAVRPDGPPRPTRPPTREDPVVLFLGSLDNANNQDAIRWFGTQCWPQLRTDHPQAHLHVVGRRAPVGLVESLTAEGARVTVDAPDIAPHLAGADVFVNPMRRGAGVNIKMIEAMAAGLPVVTTPVGARGLHWRSGEHLLVADGPAELRAAVACLLTDPNRRAELAASGQDFVQRELDGVALINRLREAVRSAAASR